jgi:CBS domain-containing protein
METITSTREAPADPGPAGTDGVAPERRPLCVGDIMSTEVITVAECETMFAAAARMSEHGVSCVVVTSDAALVGILTEKDVLKGVAQSDTDFRRLQVRQRMSRPAHVVPADTSLLEAGKIMAARGIKRLPVIRDGQLVGIVTQTDITRGLIAMSALRYVRDIMTPEVATLDAEATAEAAARLMSTRGISCLVVRHRQQVAGILTEKDLLRRVVALHRNPAQTRVAEIMSFPITTVPPTHSILSASKKMETMHLHRLVVMDDQEICGIITQTDIMRAMHGAFAKLESQRNALAARLTHLLGSAVPDSEELRRFLHGLENPPLVPGVRADDGASPGPPEPWPATDPYIV